MDPGKAPVAEELLRTEWATDSVADCRDRQDAQNTEFPETRDKGAVSWKRRI